MHQCVDTYSSGKVHSRKLVASSHSFKLQRRWTGYRSQPIAGLSPSPRPHQTTHHSTIHRLRTAAALAEPSLGAAPAEGDAAGAAKAAGSKQKKVQEERKKKTKRSQSQERRHQQQQQQRLEQQQSTQQQQNAWKQHSAEAQATWQQQGSSSDAASSEQQQEEQQADGNSPKQQQQQQREWHSYDQQHYEQAARNMQPGKQRAPCFRAAAETNIADLTSAIIVTLRRKKRLNFYAAASQNIYKAVKSLAFARPYLNLPDIGLDAVFQVNMAGHPLNPRIINSKICMATFSMQYVEGIDTLFANKSIDPYFVNRHNDVTKCSNLVIALVRNEGTVVVQSEGVEGVTQMMRVVAHARRRLLPRNEDIACVVRAYRAQHAPTPEYPEGSWQVRVVLLLVRCLPFQPLCWVVKPVVPDSAGRTKLPISSSKDIAQSLTELMDEEQLQREWSSGGVRIEEMAREQVAKVAEWI